MGPKRQRRDLTPKHEPMPRSIKTARPRKQPSASYNQRYYRERRDREVQRFYDSAAWKKVRKAKIQANPLCERCLSQGKLEEAKVVHHKVEVRVDDALALDMDNLESLCSKCHNKHHMSMAKGRE